MIVLQFTVKDIEQMRQNLKKKKTELKKQDFFIASFNVKKRPKNCNCKKKTKIAISPELGTEKNKIAFCCYRFTYLCAIKFATINFIDATLKSEGS